MSQLDLSKKYCKYCGEIIDADCVICPKCGRQVEDLEQESAAPESCASDLSNTVARGQDDRSEEFMEGIPIIVKIILWILFLPIVLSLWIWKASRINMTWLKAALIALVWVFFLPSYIDVYQEMHSPRTEAIYGTDSDASTSEDESETSKTWSDPNLEDGTSEENSSSTATIEREDPQEEFTEEILLYDQNGIKIMCTGYKKNDFTGFEVNLRIQNNSEQNITVQPRDTSVNGYMVDGAMSCDVISGKTANDSIYFYKTLLEQNDITTINNIEFYLDIFDKDNWSDIVKTPVITLTTNQEV